MDPSNSGTALYRAMVRIRAFENAAEAASQGGVSAYGQQAAGAAKVRGPLHLGGAGGLLAIGAHAALARGFGGVFEGADAHHGAVQRRA